MAAVRIWVKKKLTLEPLTFLQRDMVKIGSAGLLSVFQRISQHKGPMDAPAMPLKKGYAIWKSRKGKGRFRDLKFSGDMLRNLTLRTVSENSARAGLTSRKERIKGLANAKREVWCVYSPANKQIVIQRAVEVLAEAAKRMVTTSGGANG
jgi:hypothetical protein